MSDATNTMLCWTPNSANVALVAWPDNSGAADLYQRSALACYPGVRSAKFADRVTLCFVEAVHLIVRDGVDPQAVHGAMLRLDEYRQACSKDLRSMTQQPEGNRPAPLHVTFVPASQAKH